MKLKRICVHRPVPFSATLDKTLIADPAHGFTLELLEDQGAVLAVSKRGRKYIPLTNVDFYEPYSDGEATNAIPVFDVAPPAPKPVPRPIDDTIRITKSVTAGK